MLTAYEKHMVTQWGFPEVHIEFNMENITGISGNVKKNINEYVDKFTLRMGDKQKGKNLFIYSTNTGGGKTTLATVVVKELVNKKKIRTAQFREATLFMDEIVRSYRRDSYDTYIEKFLTCDVFVIDDLGKEKGSEHSLEKLFMVINDRYNKKKATVITSNYSPENLKSFYEGLYEDKTKVLATMNRLEERCYFIKL